MNVTRTAPFRASASPSLCGLDPAPSVKAPPKIQTMTGNRSPGPPAGVQTFRYRQSSLVGGESGRSTETLFGTRLRWDGCTQTLPNASARRTPSHRGGACGGFQRSSPTGGAANGIPLNARTPDGRVTPETRPLSVPTGSGIAAGVLTAAAAARATVKMTASAARILMKCLTSRPEPPAPLATC